MEKIMSGESAKQDIKGSYGEGFVIMGGDRVEVSPDGKKVTTYTTDGVETRAASGTAPAQGISISADFNTVVLNGVTIERAADGHLVISAPGTVITKPGPANDSAAKAATYEIGSIESAGEHKGEIYGGIFPDGKPGWILEEPKPLTHYDACELKGRALLTSKEGKYIDTIKDKGALKDIFARHSDSSSSAGYFWLAEHSSYSARYQQFSDGSQGYVSSLRDLPLPVLSVRR
jgi:hypothetical protein